MELAELGLSIRSDGVVVATNRLRDLEGQAGRTEKAGALMAKAFAVMTAAFSVSKLIDYTNRWTDLSSRVEIATGSIGAGAATMGRLADMARRTYSSLDQTAEGFLLNATAMREMGATTGQTLDYVEALNNAMVISGAKGDKAASVMNALGKAMALGKLSGENLNTVLASGDRVASALADSMGVTTLELRALGAAGKITSKDILGITSQLELLRAEADSMPATIGDAFVLLGNSIMQMVGQFDQAKDGSSRVAEAIIWLADAMKDGTITAERLLGQMTAFAVFMGAQYLVGLYAAAGATNALSFSLGVLRVALIRTGIGALVVLAGELVYQLWNVVDGSDGVGDAFNRLRKSGVDTFERVVSGGEYMWHTLVGAAKLIEAAFTNAWAGILGGLNLLIQGVQDGYNAMAETFGQPTIDFGFAAVVEGQTRLATEAHKAGLNEMALAREAFDRMFEDKNQYDGIGKMPSFGEIGATLGKPGTLNLPATTDKAAEKAAEKYKDLVRGAHEFISAQNLEAQALGMTAEAANRLRYEQDLLNQAANDNIKLTPTMRSELTGLAAEMAATEERTRSLSEAYEFGKSTFGSFMSDFRRDLMNGTSLWDSFANAGAKALDSIAGRLTQMASDQLFNSVFNMLGGGGFMGGTPGAPPMKLGFQTGIPGYADGTTNHPGGLAWVGERGRELVNLPAGSQVYSHQRSMAMSSGQGQSQSSGSGRMTLELIMPEGWRAEIIGEANNNAVQIVQRNSKAHENYRMNGGN